MQPNNPQYPYQQQPRYQQSSSPEALIKAHCAQGTLIVAGDRVIIRLFGTSEQSIARSAISSVRLSLGLFIFVGFLRDLTLYVQGEARPVKVTSMRKSKAKTVKALLGF